MFWLVVCWIVGLSTRLRPATPNVRREILPRFLRLKCLRTFSGLHEPKDCCRTPGALAHSLGSRVCPRLAVSLCCYLTYSNATARYDDLNERQLCGVLFKDDSTVIAKFGPGLGAALLVDSVRSAMALLLAAPRRCWQL